MALRGEGDPDIESSLVVDDIRDMLKGFQDTNFSFVKRNANHVAYFFSVDIGCFWIDDVPEDCKSLVCKA